MAGRQARPAGGGLGKHVVFFFGRVQSTFFKQAAACPSTLCKTMPAQHWADKIIKLGHPGATGGHRGPPGATGGRTPPGGGIQNPNGFYLPDKNPFRQSLIRNRVS